MVLIYKGEHMKDDDMKKMEKMFERVIKDLFTSEVHLSESDTEDEAIFPIGVLNDMEDYLGHPIDFMGIS